MASTHTAISWTDATWNVLRGCSRVSLGCGGPHGQGGCYAERLAIRFAGPGQPYEGLVKSTPAGPRWTGEVRFVEEALTLPLRWRTPRRIFVNSMSDLFHEKVADEWIDRIFAVMLLAQRHTYQVLTKRPERMRAYLSDPDHTMRVLMAMNSLMGPTILAGVDRAGSSKFPCPAIHLGVSVEDQATVNARIPHLFETPAAVRWVSYEPMLGPVDFTRIDGGALSIHYEGIDFDALHGFDMRRTKLDWIVAGGESGPGARPPHPDWFRSARDQCVAAGVPYFFKQWGEYAPVPPRAAGPGRMVRAGDIVVTPDGRRAPIKADLSCDLEGAGIPMRRFGKKAAGAMLDGREWREFP